MSVFWMLVESVVVIGLFGYIARRVSPREVVQSIGEGLPPGVRTSSSTNNRSHHAE